MQALKHSNTVLSYRTCITTSTAVYFWMNKYYHHACFTSRFRVVLAHLSYEQQLCLSGCKKLPSNCTIFFISLDALFWNTIFFRYTFFFWNTNEGVQQKKVEARLAHIIQKRPGLQPMSPQPDLSASPPVPSPPLSPLVPAAMAVAAPGQLNLDEAPSWGSRSVDCFEKLEQIGEGTYG